MNYTFIKDYRDNKKLVASFIGLANTIFQIDFSDWMALGYWDNHYIPYSLFNEGEIIANASVYKGGIKVNGTELNVIQIGTVMTKSAYRHQGLAEYLLKKIINDYQQETDIIYLFANETVLDFYPKFGFKRVNELNFRQITKNLKQTKQGIYKTSFPDVQYDIERIINVRYSNQSLLSFTDFESLSLFYASTVFCDALYYISDLSSYILFEKEEHILHIYDVISERPVNVSDYISYLPVNDVDEIIWHFPVNSCDDDLIIQEQAEDDDALFVLGGVDYFKNIKLPLVTHC
ncbi:GNAT family N-acetyltransferase [Vagococcus vulneris]|uniref:N-acetyltransferase domain-containing protein n=1 Tax=Vagococcus vulneris TaxID=1977869 RepID=A0A429ZQ12_9ENTE|nr:GNAT family N-acetyltransferase [Vagococcus vulneris]RST95803.1 hypothetical protein CBF37_11320 [Vagococcus vulneris]